MRCRTLRCWPVKRSVQEHWRTPYFLRQQHINAQEAKDSFELWFSLAGGGALSHADVPCWGQEGGVIFIRFMMYLKGTGALNLDFLKDAKPPVLYVVSSIHFTVVFDVARRTTRWLSRSSCVGQRNGVWPCTHRLQPHLGLVAVPWGPPKDPPGAGDSWI